MILGTYSDILEADLTLSGTDGIDTFNLVEDGVRFSRSESDEVDVSGANTVIIQNYEQEDLLGFEVGEYYWILTSGDNYSTSGFRETEGPIVSVTEYSDEYDSVPIRTTNYGNIDVSRGNTYVTLYDDTFILENCTGDVNISFIF